MSKFRYAGGPVLLASLLVAVTGIEPSYAAEEPEALPDISVVGRRDEQLRITLDPGRTPVTLPTTGELLRRMPGGNLNYNGPLTGIGQYRGMFAYRLNTQVDGVPISAGGPNWMDAPLHYAPLPLLEELEVQRGIAPVSAGSESIGGHVQARRISSRFTDSRAWRLGGELNASTQSADRGYGLGALLGVSNRSHRLHALGVVEEGDDMEFSGGDILPTRYERTAWGLGYGFREEGRELGIEYLRNETGDSGTPALPMDIRSVDTHILNADYEFALGRSTVAARVYYSEVDHSMDNFGLRLPPPDPARYRRTVATGEATGWALSVASAIGEGLLEIGLDGDLTEHDADVSNPGNPVFFVENFDRAERDRYGVYAEWSAPLDERWAWELGGRYTRIEADAARVDGTPAMMMPPAARLRDRFNSADRDLSWNGMDMVARLTYRVSPALRFDIGLARKERAPVYQELYLWLPLQATAGLADGKSYVGNISLETEKSRIVDLGLVWRTGRFYLSPHLFYERVDDYIQGTPAADPDVIAVSSMMGDPRPLAFDNVNAELYGFDADFGLRLGARWRLDGVLSYVRGERRDIDDNLYRIAPLSSIIGLTYERASWTGVVEGMFAASQEEVSAVNEETPTPGYGVMNLYGSYRVTPQVVVTAGVNNVFDKRYRDHTSGISRVRNSDVPAGQRLPGAGRSLFLRLSWDW